ncbi:jasmonate ZIM domain-containing protein 1-like [Vigna umbellata]|uniref:jasmonate ZIM domain-containing protein 1-like n=1 Tax=Vigna umbellata TaxID=87088 RepID=UPI001F5F246E|nr:jasmonate ZIM domain-containing protein 1-like [Vigna umbellata]
MSSFPNTVSEGRRFGKAPEKSSFSQTCSLLSQFLKEKRASGDSTLGMGGKMEPKASTKDLFGSLQNSDGALKLSASAMDFLPQLVENPCIKKPNLRSAVPESPQMTIFYAGKMLVFDAFPPEKATEVMELATKLALDSSGGEETPPSAPVTTKELAETKVPQTNTSEAPKPGSQGVGSDMRYPRRASLLKFLEKRKERVNARGPYQVNNQKPEGSSSGGDPEDQSSKQFDLNL